MVKNEGMLISGSNDQTMCLWEASPGDCLNTLQGYSNEIWSTTFSQVGNWRAKSMTRRKGLCLYYCSERHFLVLYLYTMIGIVVHYSYLHRIHSYPFLLLRRLFRFHVRSCVGSPAQHVVEHACDKHTDVVGDVGTVQQVGHWAGVERGVHEGNGCLLYTSPSPRDLSTSRMPSSA